MKEMQVIKQGEQKCNGSIPRIAKSFDLIGKVTITSEELGYASVESATKPGKFYNVCWKTKDCDCPDCQYRHVLCAHIRAVVAFVEMTDKK